jgi:hypothetical protein
VRFFFFFGSLLAPGASRQLTHHRIVILITFFIYIRAGSEIYKKHKQLRYFGSTSHHEPDVAIPLEGAFTQKTTEVSVTSEAASQPPIDLEMLGRRDSRAQGPSSPPGPAYSVSISATKATNRDSWGDIPLPIQTNNAHEHIAPPMAPPTPGVDKRHANRQRRKQAFEANSATWQYTKCAILFFTALLVTWIPSSANRVYSVVHEGRVSLTLEYMSAFVLPLQGFWNVIIYVVTSWKACKMLWYDLLYAKPAREPVRAKPERSNNFSVMRSQIKSEKSYETESMTELANSRPSSTERR